MNELALTPQIRPTVRRGRPPGVRNRRSLELGKYIEARFGNLTPGQVLAELAMPTPAEIKRAKTMSGAMAEKARQLGEDLKIGRADAFAILVKLLFELAPYVHQKQPQAAPPAAKGEEGAVFIVPDGADQPLLELVDDFDPDELQVP